MTDRPICKLEIQNVFPPGKSYILSVVVFITTTGAALLENNEASAELTTANGGTFTSSSTRLSSQSHYSTLDQ